MPTASVTSDVTSAMTLISSSCARGTRSRITIPTAGMNTASVSAQSSNQSIESIPLVS